MVKTTKKKQFAQVGFKAENTCPDLMKLRNGKIVDYSPKVIRDLKVRARDKPNPKLGCAICIKSLINCLATLDCGHKFHR